MLFHVLRKPDLVTNVLYLMKMIEGRRDVLKRYLSKNELCFQTVFKCYYLKLKMTNNNKIK